MIVNSERVIALTCPACQLIQEHSFSLFALAQQPLQLLCRCGFSQGYLRKTKNSYELAVLGVDGDRVRLAFQQRKFLRTSLLNVYLPKSGQELGYIGYPEAVKEALTKGPKELWFDLENFSNPQIMRKILGMLQDLAEQDKIRCECEHPSIGLDVYSDKVELVCAFCGSLVMIDAYAPKHQETLSRVTEIVMEPSMSRFIQEWLKPLP